MSVFLHKERNAESIARRTDEFALERQRIRPVVAADCIERRANGFGFVPVCSQRCLGASEAEVADDWQDSSSDRKWLTVFVG
jgi:hypothetical protein